MDTQQYTASIPRPTRRAINVDAIPQELRDRPQWVSWRYGKRADGTSTKQPLDRACRVLADANDPANWRPFDVALTDYHAGKGDGLGMSVQDLGMVFIDLDHCIDEAGHAEPWAEGIVQALDTYTERSVSGRGLHVLAWGRKPGTSCRRGKIEMYDHHRFLTVTGDRWNGASGAIESRQAEIEALYAQVFEQEKPSAPAPLATMGIQDDQELLDEAMSAKNGAKFAALWTGNIDAYDSASEADAALCSMLAFWTGKDAERMERLFSQSELGQRDKWTERPDYRKRTIEGAIATCKDVHKDTGRLLTAHYIELFGSWGFSLARCDLNDIIMCNAQPVADGVEADILARVRDYGIQNRVGVSVAHARDALQVAADQNHYHPVKDYLAALSWDGHDYIGELCAYIREPEPGRFLRWFNHWIVGAVARVYEPWQNPMLVLEAPQEVGKSFFARWLCPMPELYYAGPICPDDKDCNLRRMSVWIWEAEELGSTTRRQDVEALKGWLSRDVVQDRRPYGHYDMVKPALSSYIGTTNDADFLTDRSGNRRFLTAPILSIDWAYSAKIPRDQLWAQALAIYKAGDDWKLTTKDRAERDAQNAAYMVDDPVEVRLEAILEYTGKPADFIATDQIQIELRQDGFNYGIGMARTIASVLRGWGAKPERRTLGGAKERGYAGVVFRAGK